MTKKFSWLRIKIKKMNMSVLLQLSSLDCIILLAFRVTYNAPTISERPITDSTDSNRTESGIGSVRFGLVDFADSTESTEPTDSYRFYRFLPIFTDFYRFLPILTDSYRFGIGSVSVSIGKNR